jgi:hypothetical protein
MLLEMFSKVTELLCTFYCCVFAVWHSCLMYLQLQLKFSSLQPVQMTFQAYITVSWHLPI